MKKKTKPTLPSYDAVSELTVEPKPEPTQYLIDVSNRLKAAKLITIVFLVVFLLSMIMIFRKDITLENFQYMIRLYTSSELSYNGDYQEIYYDSSGTTKLGMFHGDLAVLKRDGVSLYNMKGSALMQQALAYTNPALITSGKYMLTYDIGGNTFDLFNNFSRLSGESFDYPISSAAVSPEGMYAVVSKSSDYQSVIYLYDHNFNLLSRISKNKYVMGMAIADDASELLIVSSYSNEGVYNTEIMTYEPYTDTARSTVVRGGSMGVMCGYHSDGSYTVLCTDALLFFSADDELTASFPLAGITPTKCVIAEDCTVLTYNQNAVGNATTVLVFSNDGAEPQRFLSPEKVIYTACMGKKIYLLCSTSVIEFDRESGSTRSAVPTAGGTSIFSVDESTFIIGYSNMVKAYDVEALFGPSETTPALEPDDTRSVETVKPADDTASDSGAAVDTVKVVTTADTVNEDPSETSDTTSADTSETDIQP